MPRHLIQSELILAEGADSRAPGGAVTIALCGHWDHAGGCRWPHLNKLTSSQEKCLLNTEVTCSIDDLEEIIARIRSQLENGYLIGPDGIKSEWRLVEVRLARHQN